jgi:hypothetical protein
MEQEIEDKIKELSDLSNLKVGDTLWTLFGEETIIDINNFTEYKIQTDDNYFTLTGKFLSEHEYPSAFIKNPFIEIVNMNKFQERWMMVSDDDIKYVKRKVFMIKNGKYLAWVNAETDEDIIKIVGVFNWNYAKEIQEPKILELTLEQIAEKFNVNISDLKIVK